MRDKIFWVLDHLRAILFATGTIAVILFVGLYLLDRRIAPKSTDYEVVDSAYQNWSSAAAFDQEAFTAMMKKLDVYPELHARYDAKIVQQLMIWKEGSFAEKLGLAALQRLSAVSPLDPYRQFAQDSLLISVGMHQKALDGAKQLQISLEQSPALKNSYLYRFNLLRIASLENEVGSPQSELMAWKAFEDSEKTVAIEKQIVPRFRQKEVSLGDYIEFRKEIAGVR